MKVKGLTLPRGLRYGRTHVMLCYSACSVFETAGASLSPLATGRPTQTKRHERMRRLMSEELAWIGRLPNVWFGVSIENRRHGLPRLRALRKTPVALRFLSV